MEVMTSRPTKIISVRDVIRDVPAHFRDSYARYNLDHKFPSHTLTVGEILKNLAAIDVETASRADVDAAMGKTPPNSWTILDCDCCGKSVDQVVRFGDGPDYEARWQDLCADCLAFGQALLRDAPPK